MTRVPPAWLRREPVGRVADVSDYIPEIPNPFDVSSADSLLEGSGGGILDNWTPTIEQASPGGGAVLPMTTTDETAAVDNEASPTEDATKKVQPTTSSGRAVLEAIQTKLLALGYDIGKSGIDGKMGPATASAIAKFKRDHGIAPPNGTVTQAFRAGLVTTQPPKAKASASLIVGLGVGASVGMAIASLPAWAVAVPVSLAIGYVAVRKR